MNKKTAFQLGGFSIKIKGMLKNLKQFNLPELEEKVLKFWKEHKIFEKSVALRQAQGKPYRFFEGPPTANGRPGIHHVFGRAFKDLMPRYKTMRGFFVRRKAGWDTHGLPVEIEVEKELGLKQKQEIEKFGIAAFNEKAKSSVWKYKDEWEKLTERIGFWLDMKDPYITYKSKYIESLWWVFKQIANRGLLKRSFKIVPYCPRCQTPLSSHEMGQPGVYKKVKDPSIFVKFRVRHQASGVKNKEYLLVWTTTPWTLPSNVAVAVNPTLTYTKFKVGDEFLWAYQLPAGVDGEVVEKISGKKLVGLQYKPLFSVKGPWLKNKKFFKVYPADFVSTEDGTGMVHIAPAFGEDDMRLIEQYEKDLVGKIPMLVDERGILAKGLPGAGKFVKQADKEIIGDLEKRGALLKKDEIEHDYPFCWRCSTPLLYFSQFSWFITMSQLRDKLLANNQKINWVPGHIKEGRFGEWLREVKDWAVSRNRYWGTPLPIWECEKCEHQEVVGSLAELDKLAFPKNRFFLLRHGESNHNSYGKLASGPERGANISHLTEGGKESAARAADQILKMLGKDKLDAIFVSPYARTKETAKIVIKKIKAKLTLDKRLEEINGGVFNWRPIEERDKFFSTRMERFTKTPAGGENLRDVRKRVVAAISDINSRFQGKNILIVSHGDPLLMLEGVMRGYSEEEMLEIPMLGTNGEVREAEFHNWPYNSFGELDLHRPYVDNIFLNCKECGGKMVRAKEVADVWFDSGSMPFAQFHYPFSVKRPASSVKLADLDRDIDYPADYICEAVDQTRGWFYTLLAVATALGLDTPPYRNVLTYGILLDKHGLKMSKSKGNTVDPWEMIRKYGADVVRWYFYSSTVPCESKSFDEADLGKVSRKLISLLYNSFVFYETYGASSVKRQASSKNVLDHWILARLNQAIETVMENLEKYEIGAASKALEIFMDDLSRWYIRRSRPRFQRPKDSTDHKAASATLYECLLTLSKLLAPFTPFFAEGLYMSLQASGVRRQASVHLEGWPEADKKSIDYSLMEKMGEARRLASLALAFRTEKGIKVRQPLQTLEVRSSKLDARDKELIEILKDEVNVKEVKWNLEMREEVILDTKITPELKEEGLIRDLVRTVQGLRHDAGYVPKNEIAVLVAASKIVTGVIQRNESKFKKDVGAKIIEYKKSDKFDAELQTKLDNEPLWVGVRKVK